jgi:ABC-type transporter MlaC component
VDFAPADNILPTFRCKSFLPSDMSSKHTVSSLHTLFTEMQTQIAELKQQVAALSAPAPAQPAVKEKRAKKERDPSKPKRPLGAYMLFCQAQRAAHTGDTKLTAAMLGEQWKALTPEAQAAFKPAPAAEPAAEQSDTPDAPKKKRALSPYLIFCQQRRAETPDVKLTAKELGAEWKALTPEQQSAYKAPSAAPSDDDEE